MPRIATGGVIGPLALNRQAAPPLYRQLYDELRALILSGRLRARQQAALDAACWRHELGVSRNTVLQAFEQLMGEGYLEGRRGAGSFVSRDLPHRPRADSRRASAARPLRGILGAGPRHRRRAWAAGTASRMPFAPGSPDVAAFPADLWARLLARTWRRLTAADYAAGDRAGYPPLRAAIADYLAAERAMRCSADQVLIFTGIRQAIDLTLRRAGRPRRRGLDGGAGLSRRPRHAGCGRRRAVPVPVDGEGLVGRGRRAAGAAAAARLRLAVAPVSAGRHDVAGAAAGAAGLCARVRAWVLEDDYDSEFRYSGRPLAALQGLDDGGARHLRRQLLQGAVPGAAPRLPGGARWRCWKASAAPAPRWTTMPARACSRRWRPSCRAAISAATSGRCAGATRRGRQRCSKRREPTSAACWN